MKRVLDGAIGEIVAIQETYNTGTLWHRARQPDWTEMEFQMRNWYYFTWLSGDHNVEQHVHSLDKAAWAMRDEPPLRAWGLGGRQVRTEPASATSTTITPSCYEYASGVPVYSYCRQMAGCCNDISDMFMGTKGRADILANRIEGQNTWRYAGPEARHVRRRAPRALFAPSARASRSTTACTWPAARCWPSWAAWRPIPARP